MGIWVESQTNERNKCEFLRRPFFLRQTKCRGESKLRVERESIHQMDLYGGDIACLWKLMRGVLGGMRKRIAFRGQSTLMCLCEMSQLWVKVNVCFGYYRL